MAPEVRRGAPPLPESDLYSLARTLEHVLGEDEPLLREWLRALSHEDPARRPRWDTRDPLVWLERIRRSLEKEVARV